MSKRKIKELNKMNNSKINVYISGIKYNTDFLIIDYNYSRKTLKFYNKEDDKVYTGKITGIKRGENKKRITASKTNWLNKNFLPDHSQKYLKECLKMNKLKNINDVIDELDKPKLIIDCKTDSDKTKIHIIKISKANKYFFQVFKEGKKITDKKLRRKELKEELKGLSVIYDYYLMG